jgi:hypothetical protein
MRRKKGKWGQEMSPRTRCGAPRLCTVSVCQMETLYAKSRGSAEAQAGNLRVHPEIQEMPRISWETLTQG